MKKVVINRVDLGSRVVGYEVLNPGVNGTEVLGYTPQAMKEAVRNGEIMGMVLNATGDLVLDEAKGFKAIMVKTGIGTLTSTDPSSVANIIYTAYDRVEGDKFKVVSSRFGRQIYCAEKVKALLDLGAVNGVVLEGETLKGAWELEERTQPPVEPESKAEGKAPVKEGKASGKKK